VKKRDGLCRLGAPPETTFHRNVGVGSEEATEISPGHILEQQPPIAVDYLVREAQYTDQARMRRQPLVDLEFALELLALPDPHKGAGVGVWRLSDLLAAGKQFNYAGAANSDTVVLTPGAKRISVVPP